MATDIIEGLKTREEYLDTVQLSYAPVALAIRDRMKHDIANSETIKFRQLDIEQDSIVAENLTAGQTEYAHIKAKEGVKNFVKLIKGAKIIQSVRNFGYNRLPQLMSKIIRGYSIIFDQLALFGADGNNGVINTTDANAIANAAVEIDLTAAPQDILNQVVGLVNRLRAQVSNNTASSDVLVYVYGQKLEQALGVVTYNGSSVRDAVYAAWPEARFVTVSGLVNVNDVSGMTAISQDLVTLNYVSVPNMSDEGYNREDKYFWADFEVGSTMVDVREYGALINQPLTFKEA